MSHSPAISGQFPPASLPASLRIRFSNAADLAAIQRFNESNPHQNYAYRVAETPVCVNDGFMLMIEAPSAAAANPDHILVGASGAFPKVDPDQPDQHWTEIGQTRISGEQHGITVGGLGVYQFIVASQALLSYLKEDGLRFVYAEIDDDPSAAHVTKMLHQDLRWPFMEPPAKLRDLQLAELPPDKRPDALGYDFLYMICDEPTIAYQARYVLDVIKRGDLLHKKSGNRVTLNLGQFNLANEYLPDLKNLAALHDQNQPAPAYKAGNSPLARVKLLPG